MLVSIRDGVDLPDRGGHVAMGRAVGDELLVVGDRLLECIGQDDFVSGLVEFQRFVQFGFGSVHMEMGQCYLGEGVGSVYGFGALDADRLGGDVEVLQINVVFYDLCGDGPCLEDDSVFRSSLVLHGVAGGQRLFVRRVELARDGESRRQQACVRPIGLCDPYAGYRQLHRGFLRCGHCRRECSVGFANQVVVASREPGAEMCGQSREQDRALGGVPGENLRHGGEHLLLVIGQRLVGLVATGLDVLGESLRNVGV